MVLTDGSGLCRRWSRLCESGIADGAGRAVAFRITPGQAHELRQAIPLLASLPNAPKWIVAERGSSSHAFRQQVWGQSSRPAIPHKRNAAPVACPDWISNNRNLIKRL